MTTKTSKWHPNPKSKSGMSSHDRTSWIARPYAQNNKHNWIQIHLTGPAQVLAHNLLHDLHTISHTLYPFIITSYEDTMHSGKFASSQAWKITSSFFKRIFTEIGYSRFSARYAINIDAPWSSGAGILFATLHYHYIMSKFIRLSIKYHPSISSEMVKFVCYSAPSTNTSESLTRISAVDSLQRSDQSNLPNQ